MKKNKNKKKKYLNILEILKYNNGATRDLISSKSGCSIDVIGSELKRLVDYNVITTDDGKYYLDTENLHQTNLNITSRGNGSVKIGDNEVFVYKDRLNRGLDGDLVEVVLYKFENKYEAEVVEVIERNKTIFVGIMDNRNGYGFVVTKNAKMYVDLYVKGSHMKNAKTNDVVVVEMYKWDNDSANPYAKVTNVIGQLGLHETEIHSILEEYGLPYSFPPEVIEEAERISPKITENDIADRLDLRDILSIVIDPIGARDKDDALSYHVDDNGNQVVGIHIADVTHYVKKDTKLYEEAYKRGTSVYLVDRVVPMFPEILSNGICSLHPNEDKLAYSVLLTIDSKGDIIDKWFGKTVIHIDKDYSYEEAYDDINDSTKNDDISLALKSLCNISKIFRKKRMGSETILFNKSEIRFRLDKDNKPTTVYEKKQNEANYLIEEFMLMANNSVGELISKKLKKGIYRFHDEPDTERIEELSMICRNFGYDFDISDVRSSINKLVRETIDTPEENMMNTLAIRSMKKAIYSSDNRGHWGLGKIFETYTHFTSPIRRFADIQSHFMLSDILESSKNINKEIDKVCEHINHREKMATQAERDSIKYMQIKYLEDKMDQVFRGVISSISESSLYVELIDNKCEGMVRTSDIINGGKFSFDSKKYTLTGSSNGIKYRLGDEVEVKVKNTDLIKKQIDLIII